MKEARKVYAPTGRVSSNMGRASDRLSMFGVRKHDKLRGWYNATGEHHASKVTHTVTGLGALKKMGLR